MERTQDSTAFANVLGEALQTAEARTAYERDVRKLLAFAELLSAIDEVRARQHVSKAELARRVDVRPSVISRLLNGEGKNVQLATIADVLDALDVFLEVRVRAQPEGEEPRRAPIEVARAP